MTTFHVFYFKHPHFKLITQSVKSMSGVCILCVSETALLQCDTSRFDSFMLPLYAYLSSFFIYLILLVSFFFYFNFFCSLNLTCSIVSSQRCVFFSDISSYLLDESDLTVFPIVHVCFVFFDCPGSLYHNHPA